MITKIDKPFLRKVDLDIEGNKITLIMEVNEAGLKLRLKGKHRLQKVVKWTDLIKSILGIVEVREATIAKKTEEIFND